MSSDESTYRHHSTAVKHHSITQGSQISEAASVAASPVSSHSTARLQQMPHLIIPAAGESLTPTPSVSTSVTASFSLTHKDSSQHLRQQSGSRSCSSNFNSPDSGVTDMSGEGSDKMTASHPSLTSNGSGDREQMYHIYDQPHTITLMPGDSLDVKSGNIRRTITGPANITMVSNNGHNIAQLLRNGNTSAAAVRAADKSALPYYIAATQLPPQAAGPARNGPPLNQQQSVSHSRPPQSQQPPQQQQQHRFTHSSNYPFHGTQGMPPSGPPNQFCYAASRSQQQTFPSSAPAGYHPHYHHHPIPQSMIQNGTVIHTDERQGKKISPRLKRDQIHPNLTMHHSPICQGRLQGHPHIVNGMSMRSHEHRVPDPNSCSNSTDSREDDDKTKIYEILSSILPPEVETEARSAVTRITAPEIPENLLPVGQSLNAEVQYKLYLREKDKQTLLLYEGDATSITMTDLRPATDYSVKICAILEDIQGKDSKPTLFKTLASVPDKPPMPKIMTNSKSQIYLKWNSAVDNGSKISVYILELSRHSLAAPTAASADITYEECYKGLKREYRLPKPEPSNCYMFRLAAVNDLGISEYSDVLRVETSGLVPSQPDPPQLAEATVDSLLLKWEKRPGVDQEFSLQKEEENSEYGFLHIYSGPEKQFRVEKLKKCTAYRFRIMSENEDGRSTWSQIVTYKTKSAVPNTPHKPTVKGKIQSTAFRLGWEAPLDDGGSPIQGYLAQLDSGSGYKHVYEGTECECSCSNLLPGHTYKARVAARNLVGQSRWSDSTTVTTNPVSPSACPKPGLHGKPKANSLQVKWSPPHDTGGAPIKGYVVQLIYMDNTTREAYRGADLTCTVAGLSPGRAYLLQVRAVNAAGEGDWSEPLEVLSGAGVPESPSAPSCCPKSANSVLVTWKAPCNNGAKISEYKLEILKPDHTEFAQLYSGAELSCEAKSLSPHTQYSFRVIAVNSSGPSHPSEEVMVTTLPSSPSAVSCVQLHSTATTIHISWQQPDDNGSKITQYNIEYGKTLNRVVSGEETECVLEDLSPDTSYKIRVQAINAVGAGPFSSQYRVNTGLLPPAPPSLECVRCSWNSVQLKWPQDNYNCEQYYVWKSLANSDAEPLNVYQGSAQQCKISKLQENTTYSFSISASNSAGEGAMSSPLTVTTHWAPPHALKAPHVSNVGLYECQVSWSAVKSQGSDVIEYRLQLSDQPSNSTSEIYRGEQTTFNLTELKPGTLYSVRVCPVRLCKGDNSIESILGPYSPSATFKTDSLEIPEVQAETIPEAPKKSTCKEKLHQVLRHVKPRKEKQVAIILIASMFLASLGLALVLSYVFSSSDSESSRFGL